MTTEEMFLFVIDNHMKMTREELAKKLGVNKATVVNWITKMRRFGLDLPRKNRSSELENFTKGYLKTHPEMKK